MEIARTPSGGGTATVSYYVWCGSRPCQARDASNAPTRSYLDEGEYVAGTVPESLYYATDQIGSVRRVFSSGGATPAYDYDPYGVLLSSTAPVADFGYAGMFQEPDSDLHLTLFRAYDPQAATWLSRDPLGEFSGGGSGLYAHVKGDPISLIDPLGLVCVPGSPQPRAPEPGDNPASSPNRQKPQKEEPKPAPQPVRKYDTHVNYCGGEGGARFPNQGINQACYNHDVCYGGSGTPRSTCDLTFAGEIYLRRLFLNPFSPAAPVDAALWSLIYGSAVALRGGQFYVPKK